MNANTGCYLWVVEPRTIPGAPPPGTPRTSGEPYGKDASYKNEVGMRQSARITGTSIKENEDGN